MRLAFLGTPEAAVPSLRALVEAGHDVEIVITRPDRKRGRGGELSPSPVKACAQEFGLRVAHRLGDLDDVDVERGVVVAYGRLIPGELLGADPDAERALLVVAALARRGARRARDPRRRRETGVSIMTLDADLDTGPVHLERRVRDRRQDPRVAVGRTRTVGRAGAHGGRSRRRISWPIRRRKRARSRSRRS